MKKTKLIAVFILTIAFIYAFTGCGKKEGDVSDKKPTIESNHDEHEHNKKDTTNMASDGKYFCPMHPTQQSNDAGAKCPVCKMNMMSKDEHNKDMMKKHEDIEGKHAGMKNMLHFEVQLSKLKSDECEKAINKALKNTQGVMDFYIDILESRVHMYVDKSKTTKKDIEKVIADLGYDANDTKANPEAAGKLPADCK